MKQFPCVIVRIVLTIASWPLLAAVFILSVPSAGAAGSRFCAPLAPPASGETVVIIGPGENLVSRVGSAAAGTTFLLQDGTYQGGIEVNADRITIRSLSGNREAVIIEGGANNISVNADDFTVADLTLRKPDNWHCIQIRGEMGAMRPRIYNVHMVDAVQQFVKGSTNGSLSPRLFSDNGEVACSLIEYTTKAPSDYTNGVDVLAGRGWVIRDNVFRRIRGPLGPAGPTILMWRDCMDTVVKRNVIIDCWRGIALGLSSADKNSRGGSGDLYDHQNGLVENNVILGLREPMDSAIENNYALGSKIYHNTVYRTGTSGFSLEYRFSGTTVDLVNNLLDKPAVNRSPGAALGTEKGTLVIGSAAWFKNLTAEDFHLADNSPALDKGVAHPETTEDIEGQLRPQGSAPDPGADEWENSALPPPPANTPPAAPSNLKVK